MKTWLKPASILCVMTSVYACGQSIGGFQYPTTITANQAPSAARFLPLTTDQPLFELPTSKPGAHPTDCVGLLSRTAPMFSGCIKGADKGAGLIRVRLTGTSGILVAHTRTDESGVFSFRHLPAGQYVLLVIQDSHVLCVRSVRVPPTLSHLIFDISLPRPVPDYEF